MAIKIVLDGQSSTPHNIDAGVPKGSVLGPTLFLVYINNLPDGALSRIGIYADDITAYSRIQTSDFFDRLDAELEEDLRCIVEWGEKWLVSFNAAKSKLLSFNCHHESILIPLKMKDIGLPECDSFRFLGLVLHPNLIGNLMSSLLQNKHHKETILYHV